MIDSLYLLTVILSMCYLLWWSDRQDRGGRR
jgi:hypothetical protein